MATNDRQNPDRNLREICLWVRFIGIMVILSAVVGSCVGVVSVLGL